MRFRPVALLGLALLLGSAADPPRTPPAATPIARLETPWWRERHARKLAERQAGPVDLVFLGDSITQNWERTGPPPWTDFRPVWERFYGDRHALNLGFSGDSSAHLLWRITHGEIDGLAPKAAVILIGANNLGRAHYSAADDVAGIAAVVDETRRRLARTRILLIGILPSERSEWATRTTAEVNRALAARYGAGDEPGVTWFDPAPVFAPGGQLDRSLFYDSLLTPPQPLLHPTPEGQARLAGAIEPVLARLLGDAPHLAQ